VGSGATAGATGNTSAGGSASPQSGGSTYQLVGVQNPTQYKDKRVEVIGTMDQAGNSSNEILRVTSVRVVEGSCQ